MHPPARRSVDSPAGFAARSSLGSTTTLQLLVAGSLLLPLGLPAARSQAVAGAHIRHDLLARQVDAILRQPEHTLDLGRVKLSFDRLIDPAVDVEAGLKRLDDMAAAVRAMVPDPSPDRVKVQALRAYLYQSGPWNGHQPFTYDLDDPLGHNIRNKLLLPHLASRKGNCVTMPQLFVILGQRLGLDVTLSTAPQHYFVKFTDRQTGQTLNLEATSGASPARDAWMRQQIPMRDDAIANRLYLQKLSQREAAGAMASTLVEHVKKRHRYESLVALADVLLAHNPRDIVALLGKASAYGAIAAADRTQATALGYPVPPEEVTRIRRLFQLNHDGFELAEKLGWREPTPEQQAAYLQRVSQFRGKP